MKIFFFKRWTGLHKGFVRMPNPAAEWFVKTRTRAIAGEWFVKTRTRAPKASVKYFFVLFVALLVAGCNSSSSDSSDEASDVRTPVTLTTVSHSSLNEYIELNATSNYMQQNYVKSNLNGYIEKSNIKYGDYVHVGQPLFVLKTKEARAIGNAVNRLDSSFNFSGVNVLHSNASGYVMEVNHQPGDYVQDGEQLAVISDSRSFMFVMNVPYEDKPYVSIGKHVDLLLPDNEVLPGVIASSLPAIDSVSQTQQYSISVNAGQSIPKDLIAKVKILKKSVQDAQTLPKQSILSDQTQTNYWVMKLINDSTAVKVPVKTGIEQGDTVQVLSPQFDTDTKILSGGNYGLSDTAGVIIQSAKTDSVDSTKTNP